MIKSIFIAAALLATLAPAATAQTATFEATITYDNQTSDAQALRRDIQTQAERACRVTDRRSIAQGVSFRCVDEIVEAAMAEISQQRAQAEERQLARLITENTTSLR